MPKPKIDAKEARDAIRSGMDDSALMAKYNLSPRGLQSLFRKLIEAGAIKKEELAQRMPNYSKSVMLAGVSINEPPSPVQNKKHREIRAQDAIRDIREGLSDSEIMRKYMISAKGLESLFEQLIAAKLLTRAELDDRSSETDATVDVFRPKEFQPHQGIDSAPLGESNVQWECPACGRVQRQRYEECPVCGVIVAKYQARFGKQ